MQISTNVCQEQLLAPYPGFEPRHPVVDHLLKKLFFFRLSCKLLTILCTNWEIWAPIFLCISMMNISRYARFESMFLYAGNNIVLKKGSKWWIVVSLFLQDWKTGDRVLAKWQDCKFYPAKITKCLSDGKKPLYTVLYLGRVKWLPHQWQ